MNDAAYPFRGEFSLPPGLNHGHASSPERITEAEESGNGPLTATSTVAASAAFPPSMPAATTTVITSQHFPDKGITIYSNAATTAVAGVEEGGKRRSTHHTALSHRPTSLSLRVTGSQLKIEQLESTAGQSMRCELGINGGALRPLQLQDGKLIATANRHGNPLTVPSDGKDYNLVAVLLNAKGKAEHYCHVTLNSGEGEKGPHDAPFFSSFSSTRNVYHSPPFAPTATSVPPLEWENEAYGPWGEGEDGNNGGGGRGRPQEGEDKEQYSTGGRQGPPWPTPTGGLSFSPSYAHHPSEAIRPGRALATVSAPGNGGVPSPLPTFDTASSSPSSFASRYLRLRAPPPSQQSHLSIFFDGHPLFPRDGWYYFPLGGAREGAILLAGHNGGVGQPPPPQAHRGSSPPASHAVVWSRRGHSQGMDPTHQKTARGKGGVRGSGKTPPSPPLRQGGWEVEEAEGRHTQRPWSSGGTTAARRAGKMPPPSSTEKITREREEVRQRNSGGPWPTREDQGTAEEEEEAENRRDRRASSAAPSTQNVWQHAESTPWPQPWPNAASSSTQPPRRQFLSSASSRLPGLEEGKVASPPPLGGHPLPLPAGVATATPTDKDGLSSPWRYVPDRPGVAVEAVGPFRAHSPSWHHTTTTTDTDVATPVPHGLQCLVPSSSSPSSVAPLPTPTRDGGPPPTVPRLETFVRWDPPPSSSSSSTPSVVARAFGYYMVLQEEGDGVPVEGMSEAVLPLRPMMKGTTTEKEEGRRSSMAEERHRWIHVTLWHPSTQQKVLEHWTQVVVEDVVSSPAAARPAPEAPLRLRQEGHGDGAPSPSSVRGAATATTSSMAPLERPSPTALQPLTTPFSAVGTPSVGGMGGEGVVPPSSSLSPPPPAFPSSSSSPSSPFQAYTSWLRDVANVLAERAAQNTPIAMSSPIPTTTAASPLLPPHSPIPTATTASPLLPPHSPIPTATTATASLAPPPPSLANIPPEVEALQQYIWQALAAPSRVPIPSTAGNGGTAAPSSAPPPPLSVGPRETGPVALPFSSSQGGPPPSTSPFPLLPSTTTTTSTAGPPPPPPPHFSFGVPSLPPFIEAMDAGKDVRLTATVDGLPVEKRSIHGGEGGPSEGWALPPHGREMVCHAYSLLTGEPTGSCRLRSSGASWGAPEQATTTPETKEKEKEAEEFVGSQLLPFLEQHHGDPLLMAHHLASLDTHAASPSWQRVLPLLRHCLLQCSHPASTAASAPLSPMPPGPTLQPTTADLPGVGEEKVSRPPPPLPSSVAAVVPLSAISSPVPTRLLPPPPPPPPPLSVAGAPLIHFTAGSGRIENIYTHDPSVQLSASMNHGVAESIAQHSPLPMPPALSAAPAGVPTVWTIQAREGRTEGVGKVLSEVEVTVVAPSTTLLPPPSPPSSSLASSTGQAPHTFLAPPPLVYPPGGRSGEASPVSAMGIPPIPTSIPTSASASSSASPLLAPPLLPSVRSTVDDPPHPPSARDGSGLRMAQDGGFVGAGGGASSSSSSGVPPPLPQFYLVPPPAVVSESLRATSPTLGWMAPLDRGEREKKIGMPDGYHASSTPSAATPPLLMDVALQCVNGDVQIRLDAPAGMLVVCFVDGIGGNTGKQQFSTTVPSHLPHRLTIRLVDSQCGQMCLEQRLELPAIASTRWGLSLHDGGLTLDPDACGSVSTSVSLDRSPERAVQQNAVLFDIYKPHFISLHRYFNGCHGICMGELTFRLPSFVNPTDLKSLLHTLRMWAANKIDGCDVESEMLLLSKECSAPLLREIVEVLVEICKRQRHVPLYDAPRYTSNASCGNEREGTLSLSTPRVYFRLAGGEEAL